LNPAWWTILGIAPTDDVRSVKRAYATRLKACRPEDDPQGFAQLREAYDAILSRLTSAAKKPVLQSVDLSAEVAPQPAPQRPMVGFRPAHADSEEQAEKPPVAAKPVAAVPHVVDQPPLPKPVVGFQPAHAHSKAHAEKPLSAVKPIVAPPRINQPPPAAILRPLAHPSSGPHAPLSPPVTRPVPRVTATAVRPSPHEVAGEILEEARRRDGRWSGFAAWLLDQEDLVSLDFKIAASEAVLHRIAAEGAPCREAMDALAQFFEWDDYRNTRQPTTADVLVAQARLRVSEGEFAKWLNAASNNRNSAVRTLKTVRKLGDGRRARLMASLLINRRRVLQALRVATSRYGEAVLPAVLGEKTMKFWYRVLAPLPNPLQLALIIPAGMVTAILVVTLWSINVGDVPMAVSLPLWVATLMAAAFVGTDVLGLGIRLWMWRCLPYVRRKLQAHAEALHLQSVPVQLWTVCVLVFEGAAGWWWPKSFPDWPFYAFVIFTSLGVFKERRTLYGCALATLGASVLFKLFVDDGKVPFVVLPATLWGGRMLHEWLLRPFPRMRAKRETIVLVAGMTTGLICLVLAGLHIQ
jgi:hypothetical protein